MANVLGPVGGSEIRPATTSPDAGSVKGEAGGQGTSFESLRQESLRRQAAPGPAGSRGMDDDVPPPSAGQAERLRWAAEQLEALLMHELLKSMRNTIPKTGMFDSPATNMFEEMLDEERANEMARNGGIGLAQLIYEQMSQHLPPEDEDRD